MFEVTYSMEGIIRKRNTSTKYKEDLKNER